MDELKRTYRVATLIGMALIGSLFIYAVLVEVLRASSFLRGFLPFEGTEILRYAFFACAVAQVFLIRFIRSVILSKGKGIQRFLVATIVTYVLCESIAILGLVLFLSGGDPFDFYLLAGLSLILLMLYFPRYSQWEDWNRATEGP
jgi:F0F1-type ATP synthase membrane subunit c/vacuolar-type H+-ATPase subunit K